MRESGAEGGRGRATGWLWLTGWVGMAGLAGWVGCGRSDASWVVVYASQDQVYAEPVLREFSRRTGIEVRALYDGEAVKTVGLANRLLAERRQPRCDLFWNNEPLRTHQLGARGVFGETNAWVSVGYRSRRLVINTNRVAWAEAPGGLMELTNSIWRGKVALAYPLFGTTATHFLALRRHWGEESWLAWCRALQANEPFLEEGNSMVVRRVGRGEAWVGLTDWDDIEAGRREGLPLGMVERTSEMLLIPNTVGLVRGGPHPAEASRLFEYLQSPEVIGRLVEERALEGAWLEGEGGAGLKVDWRGLINDLEEATLELKGIFLR